MLIRLNPGVTVDRAITELTAQRDMLTRLNGNAHEMLRGYLEWVSSAIKMVRNVAVRSDAERLVYTQTYDRLLGIFTATDFTVQPTLAASRVINALVQDEGEDRKAAFTGVIDALRAFQSRWSGSERLIVPDTNFFLNHEHALGDSEFAHALGTDPYGVRIVVPIVVVEELDRLKLGRDEVRPRAHLTLGRFDELFEQPTQVVRLEPQGPMTLPNGREISQGGGTVIELLFDPSGHRRLEKVDREIIDRAVEIQSIAGRPVTLVTHDTHMSMEAKVAGLMVHKLRPSSRPKSTRQERRERQAAAAPFANGPAA